MPCNILRDENGRPQPRPLFRPYNPMIPIYSKLAEDQTIRTYQINDRVSVRVRRCADGVETNDVLVDGYCYTPAVGLVRLGAILGVIVGIVARRPAGETHLGMGQWRNV